MEQSRKKLMELNLSLSSPMDLRTFIGSIPFPKDEESLEFSYFKTFANILEAFSEGNHSALIMNTKEKAFYKQISRQKIVLENPENAKDTFEILILTFSNGVGDHHFAEFSFDKETFFIDNADAVLLAIPIFA
ncbi:MAG: hypothetical protein PHE89_02015 [Alphaproteobacteria bacterium]|nr:hypothetical protein [Alphaproteobacteria bacterium]